MADFIPKQRKKEPLSMRIDFEVLKKIDKLAAEYNLSRSEFISQCINYAIEHMPQQDA